MDSDKTDDEPREDGCAGDDQRCGAGRTSAIPEQLLWAYVEGVFDPDERSRVIRAVARDDAAREQLGEIRRSIAARPEQKVSSMLAWARVVFREALERLKPTAVSVVAAIVRVRDRLIMVDHQEDWRDSRGALGAAPPDHGAAVDEEYESVSKRVLLTGPEGVTLSVVTSRDGRMDVDMNTPSVKSKGVVKVFSLSPMDDGTLKESFTGVQGRLLGGKAHLPDCPDGFLRIVAPDDLSFEVFLDGANAGA